jgi:2-polyprenyl-6-hydroxyphenyl methylase / 3-demethylubiquinone-9 3-methyltransferase
MGARQGKRAPPIFLYLWKPAGKLCAMTTATINPAEAAHFGSLAADWWNPKGSSAMLHKLNPVRLKYIREQVDAAWGSDPHDRRPLAGKRVLDVGCGAGLLAEPLARLGGTVTGVDAAPDNIAAATAHAAGQGLVIDYRAGDIAAMDVAPFDLITSMEVIEHVIDPSAFVDALAARLAPGGMLILSTPNRTAASRLLLVEGAERLGMIPRGTHDWDKFLKPDELKLIVAAAGLSVTDSCALSLSPAKGFQLGGSDALNYLMTARWP